MGDEGRDDARTAHVDEVGASTVAPRSMTFHEGNRLPLRSFARGAVAAASFAACERLAAYAGWVGYGEGRSRFFLGLALASAIGALVAPLWNRLLARALPNLAASFALFAGLGVLLHRPEILHPTGIAWLDTGLVCLLPALPLSAQLERRFTSVGIAALGATTAVLVDGFLLEPRIGFSLSLAAWALVWAFAEARAWDRDEGIERPGALRLLGLLAPSAAVGAAAGAAISISKPFLVQHLPAERTGELVLLGSALALCALGSFLASVLANAVGDRWTAAIGSALLVGGSVAGWTALSVVSFGHLPRWVEPLQAAESSPARTALALWAVVALPAASLGLVARGVWTRGARALASATLGFAAGTVLSERFALPRLDTGGSLEAHARSRVRVPRLAAPSGYALNAEGTLVRYPVSSAGGKIETSSWQGIPRGRDRSWSRLEACEILAPRSIAVPVASGAGGNELLCLGALQPGHARALAEAGEGSVLFLDPLPSLESREERGRNPCQFAEWRALPAPAVVVLSEPVVSSAGALLATTTALAKLASETTPSTSLWVWCDPRALRPEGLRTVLATWREALPSARVRVLLDGYAGPLIGLQQGAEGSGAQDLEQLELASVAVRDLRIDGAIGTLDRPRLESGSRGGAPDFDHPDAETIRALAGVLGLPEGHAALGILESLARHASAQEIRHDLTPADDRIRVVPEELDPLLEAVRRDPVCAPAIRQCEQVASVLYRKREFDILLGWMRDLAAARPDVGAFHRYLGLALLELLDKKGALAELELAVSLSPESPDARAELSKLYADAGRYPEALRLLESVWEEKPTVEIAKGLGLSYLEVEDYARARRYLEYARAKAPMDGEVAHALERLEASGH